MMNDTFLLELLENSSSQSPLRLLFVHAHPDDESIFTGGTIAKYAAQGAEIIIVTCTLGEEGEVIKPHLTGLTADHADQLGGYRYTELRHAIKELSPDHSRIELLFLGGLGCWRDSGMGKDSLHPRAFMQGAFQADICFQQVRQLTHILHRYHPHVVVTYDAYGVYGHPDHIHVHTITHKAINQYYRDKPTNPIIQLWEATLEPQLVQAELDTIDFTNLPYQWIIPEKLESRHILAKAEENFSAHIQRISVADYASLQRSALQAHTSQLAVHPSQNIFVLTNFIIQPFGGVESYYCYPLQEMLISDDNYCLSHNQLHAYDTSSYISDES